MDGDCKICKKAMGRSVKVTCSFGCGSVFHMQCLHLSEYDLNRVHENTYLTIKCLSCQSAYSKLNLMEMYLNEMRKQMDFLTSKLDEMSSEWKTKLSENSKQSYASILQNNSAVIIKPKDKTQKSDKTKEDLQKNVVPKDVQLKKVFTKKSGEVVISCENKESTLKMKRDVEEKLSDNYEVEMKELGNPRIIVFGLSEKIEDQNLIQKIRAQNAYVLDSSTIIVKTIIDTKRRQKRYNVVIEIDKDLYENVMKAKHLLIGWDKCDVKDNVYILRCFKCLGYGHKSSDCKEPKKCSKCTENHLSTDCKVEELKCINCMKAVNELNLKNIKTNHSAFDKNCPVYKRQVKLVKDKFF